MESILMKAICPFDCLAIYSNLNSSVITVTVQDDRGTVVPCTQVPGQIPVSQLLINFSNTFIYFYF